MDLFLQTTCGKLRQEFINAEESKRLAHISGLIKIEKCLRPQVYEFITQKANMRYYQCLSKQINHSGQQEELMSPRPSER